MKNILITGGAGFIGSNIAIKLFKKGYSVRVLDNLSNQIHGSDPEKTSPLYKSIINKVEFFKGSVTSKDDWKRAIKNQDAVIHLAAETGTGQSMYRVKDYVDVNIGGTALLLDTLTNEKHSISKVILSSSRAVYGEGKYKCSEHGIVYPQSRKTEDMLKGDFDCKCPVCNENAKLLATDESTRTAPTSIYGITKLNQEQMILTIGKALEIPTVIFRYQNVYGPGQSLSNPYTGILSIFSTRIKNSNTINIFEDGKESRDFIYIDDLVAATVLGLEMENKDINFEIFNVGAGIPIDVLTVARSLCFNYKKPLDMNISGDFRVGDIRHNFADISKIKNYIKFKPNYDFEKGIKLFCNWVEQQEINEDNFSSSIEEMEQKKFYKKNKLDNIIGL